MRDDQKTKAELGSGAGGKKTIKEAEKLRARKAKLERVSSELTKRKNADEKLYKARADWEKTFDAISDWIALIDLKGRILRTNRSGEDFTGISSDQIVGQSCCKLVHGSEEYIPGCPLQKMLHSRQRERAELKVPDTNRWLLVTVDPVTDKEGNLVGVVHITRDVTERKKAEEAKHREELLSDSIVDNMPAGIAFLDNDFVLRRFNRTYAELIQTYTPYTEEQALGMSYFDYAVGSRPQVEEWFQKVRDTGQVDNRYGFKLVLKQDGLEKTTYWDTSVAPVLDIDGKVKGILILTQNVTERKKAEEALRESEEHYRMLAETMNDGLGVIDEKGTYVYVNNKFGEILGYSPDDIVGRSWKDFFDKDAQKIINEQLTKRKKGIAESYELKNTRKDGQKIFLRISPQPIFDEDGKFKGSFAVITDITERKRAEEALRESQQSLVRAQQIAHIGDWDRDFVENKVKWSKELYRIFGVSPDDFEPTHKRFLNLVHPDDRELVSKITTNAASGKQPFSVDYRIVRPDGTECAVQSQGEVHTDNNGQVSRICGTVQDITERKKAEEALQDSEKKCD